jgi:hypothetical protein
VTATSHVNVSTRFQLATVLPSRHRLDSSHGTSQAEKKCLTGPTTTVQTVKTPAAGVAPNHANSRVIHTEHDWLRQTTHHRLVDPLVCSSRSPRRIRSSTIFDDRLLNHLPRRARTRPILLDGQGAWKYNGLFSLSYHLCAYRYPCRYTLNAWLILETRVWFVVTVTR